MNLVKLAIRSLLFYRRTNLGVVLSVMVAAAVLAGALVVGDSVRFSLLKMVDDRLGDTKIALAPQGRFFTEGLSDKLSSELDTLTAPVLQLRGIVRSSDGTKQVNRVEVLGVDERFYKIGTGDNPFIDSQPESLVLNEQLAASLVAAAGDEVVLQIEKPALMPRDVPLAPDSDLSATYRLEVAAIAGDSAFGKFGLQANQIAPSNVFVPLSWLQEQLQRSEQANIILVADNQQGTVSIEDANNSIKSSMTLADAEMEIRQLTVNEGFEIRSKRIFIDSSLGQTAMSAGDDSIGILTYFVNTLASGDNSTPYSMVAAVEPSGSQNSIVPSDMADNEIIINQWLADDLAAEVGDSIELRYYVLMPMRKLQEENRTFSIREILPMQGKNIDPELMPDFPGLSDAENCIDWDPGIDIDLDKIRDKDEDYWDRYHGTPKAFVTLAAGQQMWANRYGDLTAVRYISGSQTEEDITENILDAINPATVGLFFQPVREQGDKAGGDTTDFGLLFSGLSMFLIFSALILTSLVFVFGVENRSEQIGMLMAVGFEPKTVKSLLLIEGALLSVLGAVVGTAAALIYTRIMVYALSTVWQDAIGGSQIYFNAEAVSLFAGALGSIAVSLIAIWLTLHKKLSLSARELLAGNIGWQFMRAAVTSGSKKGLWIAIAAIVVAVLLISMTASVQSSSASSVIFFGCGGLLLVAGLGLTHTMLKFVASLSRRPMKSVLGLGLRNVTRRSGRSLAVVGLLASGIFIVISVSAFKLNPVSDVQNRDSGTGGFALYGESTISILHDLNSDSGREALRLRDDIFRDAQFVQLRVHEGDDASCLNLNRAQLPGLLGVEPQQLQTRNAFSFKEADDDSQWELLSHDYGDDIVPAIGDYATVHWALKKKLGGQIEYTDEKGNVFRLRIVGILNNSIMQGRLLISEEQFVKRFPSDEGYRVFLIDSEADKADELSNQLMGRLTNFGLVSMTTSRRLEEFMVVQNTYLSIFQILGGFGLVLGSVGLGLVVLRNVLERRNELAMLQAVGFEKSTIKRMLLDEHGGLLLGGLLCGAVSALVAVAPVVQTSKAKIPYITIAIIGISAVIWILVATSFALSGELLDGLRNE